jgi:hypothetical protein
VVTLLPAAPGTPSGPTGTEYTGAYTISWSAVGTATSYRLEERFNGGSWSEIHNAAATSKAVSGKTPGSWEYQVRACNAAGCSGYSGIKTVTVAAPGTPGTPSGPSGTEYTGAYTISWSGVTGADNYRLEERLNSGSWSEIHNASPTSKAVSGKTPGSWEYRLRACSGAGCSGYSGTKTVTVSAPATPGTPSGPSFDYDGSYTISWSSVTGAASYTLQERIDAGSWTTIQEAAATSKGITAPAEGHRDYQVRACSGAGCSGYSGIATVAIALPPATSGATPGAIPGGFSVGTQGDANYSIPITVPAGTGGLKPGLALSYNHSAGNGLAGMRWTLSGITTITRCPQTVAQDTAATALNYSGDDRYCLNGQRLVNIDEDPYHADGTQYRTEIESFQRIVQQGTGASTSFYVDHGNGLRSYFGETSNSRDTGGGGLARTWFISRTVDQFGNAIEHGYDSPTAGQTVPETIAWTSNDGQSLDPRYAVTITYGDRPPDDQRSGFDSGGAAWSRTKRIDEIEVTYDDGTTVQEIATYALTYDSTAPPNGTGRSRLTAVSVCRGSECLPETLFTVRDGTPGWHDLVSTGQGQWGTPLAGDWKGDGLADLLYQDGSSNWKVAPSNGTTGFGTGIDTGVSTSIANPILQDHDGDGLTDLVYAASGGIGWLRNTGGSFGSAGVLYVAEVSVPSFSVGTVDSGLCSLDANGDGRADLIAEVEDCVYNPNNPEESYCENKYYLLLADGNAYTSIHFATLPEEYHHTNFRVGVLRRQAAHRKHPEETLRGAQGILRLAVDFSRERLERACERTLALQSYSYRTVPRCGGSSVRLR